MLENISLNPVCTFVSLTSSTIIKVNDARGFPQKPYYGNKLEYIDADGVRRTHTYTERSGYDASNMNKPLQFTIVANSAFTSNLTAGTKIRLTRAYDFRPAGSIFTESLSSMVPRILPQMLQGSRDTNSLHMADAFLCLWHPNLGRPHTFYSDSSRTWLNPLTDRAVAQKPLNSMPEHFETVHYHDATYYASMGPFAFKRSTPQPPYKIANTKGASASATGGSNTAMIFNTRASDTTFTVDALVSIEGTPKIMLDGRAYSVASINAGTNTITVNEVLAASITADSPVLIGGTGDMITAQTMTAAMAPQGLSTAEYTNQGGQYDSADASTAVMLNHYWPCGSRGGPLVSRLDGYGYVSTAWDFPRDYTFDGPVWADQDDDGSYVVTNGVVKSTYSLMLLVITITTQQSRWIPRQK